MSQRLELVISARDQFSNAFKQLNSSMKSATQNVLSLGNMFTTGVFAVGAMKAIESFQEQAGAEALLSNVVKQLGGDYKEFTSRVIGATTALQKKTVFGDEAQIQAVATLSAITGDYEKSLKALPQLLDLATVGHIDLETAARMYGKALEGDVDGMVKAFPMIKVLKNENKSAAEILQIVTERTKGAAEEFAKTQPLTMFKNALGEVMEEIGKGLIPIMQSLLDIFKALPDFIKPLLVMMPALIAAFSTLGGPVTIAIGLLVAIRLAYVAAAKEKGAFIVQTAEEIAAQDKLNKAYDEQVSLFVSGKLKSKKAQMDFALTFNSYASSMVEQENKVRQATQKTAMSVEEEAAFRKKMFDDVVAKQEASRKSAIAQNIADQKNLNQAMFELGKLDYDQSVKFLQQKIADAKGKGTEQLKAEVELEKFKQEHVNKNIEASATLAQVEKDYQQQRFDYGQMDYDQSLIFLQQKVDATVAGTAQRLQAEKALYDFIEAEELSNVERTIARNAEIEASVVKMSDAWLGPWSQALMRGENAAKALQNAFKNFALDFLANIAKMIVQQIIFNALAAPVAGGAGLVGGIVGGFKKLLGFQTPDFGMRTIPGSSQTPVPLIAHGGETIGRGGNGGGVNLIFNSAVFNADETARAVTGMLRQYKLRTGESF